MMKSEKYDPHSHEKHYKEWKQNGMLLEDLKQENQDLIRNFLNDMEIGKNVSTQSKKGGRGYGRLRNLKGKLFTLFRLLEKTYKKNIKDITEDEIMHFFHDMRKGKYKSPRTNKKYTVTGTYVKTFKTFWHWLMRSQKKNGQIINDITNDLDGTDEKPKFNYFTMEQLKTLCDNSKLKHKALMMFLFDSGIRAPTELLNVKLSDLEWNEKEKYYMLNIREETSKTFGRKIKLLLCSDIIKQYIKQEEIKTNDFLFSGVPQTMNKFLRELGYRLCEIGTLTHEPKSKTKWITNGLTMYDFRHSSACYWLPRYKSESALKYRFGWKKSDMIHYYTEFLGMKDTLQHEDLYVDISKTELEREIDTLKKDLQQKDEETRIKEEDMEKRIQAQEQQLETMRKQQLKIMQKILEDVDKKKRERLK
jgi:integrase